MFCKFCGNEVPDGVKFCATCGAAVESHDTTLAPPVDDLFGTAPTTNPYDEAQKEEHAKKSLTFGIVSLAVAYFTGIFGIIFAIIAKKNAKKYKELNLGDLDGKAKVGNILASIGIAISVFFAVIYFFSIVLGVAIGLSEAGGTIYY